jgi:hypothetical protein
MQKWEYVHLGWHFGYVHLRPGDLFDVAWIEDWLRVTFPQLRKPPVVVEAPKRELNKVLWPRARRYYIQDVGTNGQDIALALIQHLGSKGWEAIDFEGSPAQGGGWFKRPIQQTATGVEASGS